MVWLGCWLVGPNFCKLMTDRRHVDTRHHISDVATYTSFKLVPNIGGATMHMVHGNAIWLPDSFCTLLSSSPKHLLPQWNSFHTRDTLVLGLATIIFNTSLQPVLHAVHQMLQHILGGVLQGLHKAPLEGCRSVAPFSIHFALYPAPQILNGVQVWTVTRPALEQINVYTMLLVAPGVYD
jgi:hypothetical protein